MPYFVDPNDEYEPIAVGVIDQSVLAATDVRGEDGLLIVLTNPSLTDTFEGVTSSSPDGINQWAPEVSDEFNSIPPGATRRMYMPADRLYVRVVGRMLAGPQNIRLTTVKLREAQRRG